MIRYAYGLIVFTILGTVLVLFPSVRFPIALLPGKTAPGLKPEPRIAITAADSGWVNEPYVKGNAAPSLAHEGDLVWQVKEMRKELADVNRKLDVWMDAKASPEQKARAKEMSAEVKP